ncbi:MAG: cell division protein FtsA [Bacteroidales bacterium]|nr:cell division protein FtsA [Bacteroidales bacterium]MDY3911920.1 cell division protein FtsA [Sodaliphilus sp.]
MANTQYIVAIEVGSSKIVGAVAEKYSSGNIQVNSLAEERMQNSVRYGRVQNVESVKNAVSKILSRLTPSIDCTINDVFVGISGRSLHSVPAELVRSLNPSDVITKEALVAVENAAGKAPVDGYELLATVPCAYYVDGIETKTPCGQFGSQIKVNVNRIVAKPLLKKNLSYVMDNCTHVRRYFVTPLCVGSQVLTDTERSLGCMLVDFGAETTTVSIYKNDYLVYLATLPLGSRNLTRDIANGLGNMLEEDAEQVKLNLANPLDPSSESISIMSVNSTDAINFIVARTGEIVANINQQLKYAHLEAGDLNNIVLVGGGSQLKGLAQELTNVVKLNVRIGSIPSSLSITDQRLNRIEYIELYSLLARAAEVMKPGDTCITIKEYESGDIEVKKPEPPAEPERPAEPQNTTIQNGKKQKKGWFERVTRTIGKIMTEPDDE